MSDGITCTINGRAHTIRAMPQMSLLLALREILGLRATRFGCGAESCGACTVLVDGTPRFACTLPIGEIAGTEISTAEGLTGDDGDHPLIAAFLDHQAGQCGYCLPGILVRARALLDGDDPVDRARAARALDPCLCRCGAHQRILDAVMDAAGRMGRTA